MRRSCALLPVLLVLVALPGCRSNDALESPLSAPATPHAATRDLEAGVALQRTLAVDAADVEAGFAALHARGGWHERGYFTASEHDAIEGLLFRFVVNHAAFWNELDRVGGPELVSVGASDRPRAHVLALHAGLALAQSSAFLVAEFIDDPVAIAKLNEAFPRSEIPADTYERLRLAITSPERRDLLAAMWELHEREMQDPESSVAQLAASDSAFAALLAELPALHASAAARIRAVRERHSLVAGAIDESLRHSEVAALGRRATRDLGSASYATRALLFKDVSRIKRPSAQPLVFSPDQKRQIHSQLRAGDILLTYTTGYVSNIFIPGEFKHGITYVGGARERAAAGLDASKPPESARGSALRYAENLSRTELSDGARADLIEAVAEGVKFSNLDHILDTHVNRLLVLRPRLSDAERAAFVAGVFAFVGDPYDFRFDFADASRQVCTEVVYRALDGKGGIRFALTSRAGNPTLSADDVVHYHFSTGGEHFEIILFAEEDSDFDDGRARLWPGEAGARRVEQRMSAASPTARESADP